MENDLFRKPVSTFRDHALGSIILGGDALEGADGERERAQDPDGGESDGQHVEPLLSPWPPVTAAFMGLVGPGGAEVQRGRFARGRV